MAKSTDKMEKPAGRKTAGKKKKSASEISSKAAKVGRPPGRKKKAAA